MLVFLYRLRIGPKVAAGLRIGDELPE